MTDQEEPSEVLIGNELRDIAMDEDFVWLATEKGVSRYDRSKDEWKFFTIADGLVSNLVNCIAPERVEGILGKKSGTEVWFGTDSGVSVYNKVTDSWESYTTKDGLIYNKVNAISARSDDVWMGTDKGVSVLDKDEGKWMSYSSFPGIPTSKVTSLYHQASYAWVGTRSGLARYNYRHKKWEYFRTRGSAWLNPDGAMRDTDDSPIPDDRINSIDGEGHYVYIATKSVLVEYDSHAARGVIAERTAYSKLKRARRVAIDSLSRGRWLEPGVRLLMSRDRAATWEGMGWKHMSIEELMGDKRHEVSDNFLDVQYRSGQVWVATNRGLVRFDSWVGEREIFTKDNGLIDNEVNTVATIGSEVWAGTEHGLGKYNPYRRSWTNFRMEKALPSSYVTALGQDKGGMWFATRGAASRLNYEDERWKTYTRDEGLAGLEIRDVAVVGNYIWFGTDEGVSRLNRTTNQWDNFNASKTGLVSNDVTAVLVDGKYIWVGTKAGLSRYDDTTGKWESYSTNTGLLDNQINALAADPMYVWVGTRAGLNRYDKSSGEWMGYTTGKGLSNNVITSLDLDERRVYVATKGGLNMLDRETGEWSNQTRDPVNAITAESPDKVWIGGRGFINRYDLVTEELRVFTDEEAEGVSRVNVMGAQDTAQYVWFATDGGIFRYNKLDGTWWTYSPTKQRGSRDMLVDGDVRSIVGDEDFIYFGTPAGISRYDKMTGNWISYTDADGLIDPDVHDLLLDGSDLWIGTRNGISKYDTVSDIWTDYTRKDGLPSNMVYSLAMEDGRIWAGTREGAVFLEDGESSWEKITTVDGLPDNHVWSVAVEDPYIWFGTKEGAARYNRENDSWAIYTPDDGLLSKVVKSIGFEDKYVFLNSDYGTTIYDRELDSATHFNRWDGLADSRINSITVTEDQSPDKQEIWFGTYGGATRYDLVTDTAENLTRDDGLVSNKVQAVFLDGADLWFGTDSGVSKYNIEKDEWTTFLKSATISREGQSAGLISYNIKSLAVDDNYLWVGTRNGLSRYDKVNSSWDHFPLNPPTREGMSRPQTESEKIFQRVQGLIMGMVPDKAPGIETPLTGKAMDIPPPTVDPSIRAIAVDGKYLWMGSNVGLYMYDKSTNEMVGFTPTVGTVEDPEQFTYGVTAIRDISVHDGIVWIICNDKIAAFNRGASYNYWTFLSDTRVDSEVTSDGQKFSVESKSRDSNVGLTDLTAAAVMGDLIWVGRESGLSVYDSRHRTPVTSIQIPEEISVKKITAVTLDMDNIWVGTRDGLYRYSSQTQDWQFFSKDNGLASNRVSSLAVGDEYVWVGSSDRGVSRYEKSTARWQQFSTEDGLSDNNVRAIAVDGKYVWFGTFSGGVCRYDKTSDLWTTYKTNRKIVGW
jgi:ligand-binding sensor domain-containing protein